MAKKQLRVAMVGLGFMGKAHANAWLNVDKFFNLGGRVVRKAVCDVNRTVLEEFADRWDWESVETDYRKLVARDDIDIVDICTPNHTHHLIALAALKAGKNVSCEKPLGLNAKQTAELAKAAKTTKKINTVWFNYRRVPAVALARRLVREGKLGRIFHVRAVYLQDWIIDPHFPFVWRFDKKIAGSGAHGDLNAHIIDMARYITGDEFSEVCGMSHTFINKRHVPQGDTGLLGEKAGRKKKSKMKAVTVDDALIFMARFKSGAIGTFEATRFAQGRKNGNRIEINGEKGSLCFNFERMNELEFLDATEPLYEQGFKRILVTEPTAHEYIGAWWPPGHIIGYEHTFVNQASDIATAFFKRRKTVQPDFADAHKTQLVLDAALESAAGKKWVKLRR